MTTVFSRVRVPGSYLVVLKPVRVKKVVGHPRLRLRGRNSKAVPWPLPDLQVRTRAGAGGGRRRHTIFHAKIPDDETGPTVLRPLRRQPSGRPLRSVPECASEASGRCGGSKRPKEAQPLLTQSIGAPQGILTRNDPKRFDKVRTEQQK